MTLGAWMRDYLYIPLGGNKVKTKTRLFFNLWVVFFISGLWHGAAWPFIIWGIFHGVFLILDRIFLINLTNTMGKLPSMVFTYLIVLFSWVIFRADNFSMALDYMSKMIVGGVNHHPLFLDYEMWSIMAISFFFSFFPAFKVGERWMEKIYEKKYQTVSYLLLSSMALIIVILSVGAITSSGFNPFIYFRFSLDDEQNQKYHFNHNYLIGIDISIY